MADIKLVKSVVNGTTRDLKEVAIGDTISADLISDGSTNKAYTGTEQSKLSGIATGAEVNVQPDWNQATNTEDDYIKNKPTLGTAAAKNIPTTGDASATEVVYGSDSRLTNNRNAADVSAWAKNATKPTYTQDEVTDGTTNKQYSNTEKTKLSGIESNADVTDAGNVGSSINGSTPKTSMADADKIAIIDTEASNVLKTLSWTYIKSILKTYFDTLYNKYVHPNHSGDVTSVADGAQTIAEKAVTLAKMNDLAANTIIGRVTQSTGVPEALSATNVRTIINVADGATANTKAAGSDIDTGTDDAKFLTSKALADSNRRKGISQILRFTLVDPKSAYGKDHEFCIWSKTDAAITITNIEVTCDADPTTEPTGDIKWADAFIGLGNATVINDFDTTAGVRSDSSITAGSVAAGKCIYISFDAEPDAALTQISFAITYDYD